MVWLIHGAARQRKLSTLRPGRREERISEILAELLTLFGLPGAGDLPVTTVIRQQARRYYLGQAQHVRQVVLTVSQDMTR